jgi:hypothetical protein
MNSRWMGWTSEREGVVRVKAKGTASADGGGWVCAK